MAGSTDHSMYIRDNADDDYRPHTAQSSAVAKLPYGSPTTAPCLDRPPMTFLRLSARHRISVNRFTVPTVHSGLCGFGSVACCFAVVVENYSRWYLSGTIYPVHSLLSDLSSLTKMHERGIGARPMCSATSYYSLRSVFSVQRFPQWHQISTRQRIV